MRDYFRSRPTVQLPSTVDKQSAHTLYYEIQLLCSLRKTSIKWIIQFAVKTFVSPIILKSVELISLWVLFDGWFLATVWEWLEIGNFELRLHLGEECIYKERLSKKSKIILVVNNFFQTIISSNNINFIPTSEWYRIMSWQSYVAHVNVTGIIKRHHRNRGLHFQFSWENQPFVNY